MPSEGGGLYLLLSFCGFFSLGAAFRSHFKQSQDLWRWCGKRSPRIGGIWRGKDPAKDACSCTEHASGGRWGGGRGRGRASCVAAT